MAASIIAFAGSARRDSVNKQLLRAAARLAEKAGAQVTVVDLADYPMPLYDGDWETANSLPPAAAKLRQLMSQHQGLLLSCPEYNSSITPLLKNTIDWLTRNENNDGDLSAFQGKVVSLLAASPGGLGGLRGLVTVRSILSNIACTVLPGQLAVPQAHKAFTAQEEISDDSLRQRLQQQMQDFVQTLDKLSD